MHKSVEDTGKNWNVAVRCLLLTSCLVIVMLILQSEMTTDASLLCRDRFGF